MIRTRLKSLTHITAALAFCLYAGAAASQTAATLDRLAKGAVSNGTEITWYESSPENQISKVLAAFKKTYPKVNVRHVRLVGGNALTSRVIQEERATGKSADIVTGGTAQLQQLHKRDLMKDLSKENLNLPKELMPASYVIPTAASVYVEIWNTNTVKDKDVPTTWDSLLTNKRWTGHIGAWVRPTAFSQLASLWGEQKAEKDLRQLIALKPYLFKSTFPLAQGVASGEVDVALGFYHTLQPVMKAGAPVNFRLLDPTPMHTIVSGVIKSSANPDAAMLLAVWLASPEGAKAYEDATSRGNPVVPTTKMYKMLEGVDRAEWPFAQTSKLIELNKKFNAIVTDSPSRK